MTSEQYKSIIARLNEFPLDIKIEVLLADLLDNGYREDELVIQPISIFKRRFAKDVEKTKVIYDKQDRESVLFEINRDGFYDMLPQGMFHQPKDRKHYKNTAEMSESVKVLRIEEIESRKLFLPLENELYQFKALVERAEKRMLFELENNASNDYLINFWNLSAFRNYDTIAILLRFIPILYRLTTSMTYIKLCYELLIKQEVRIDIVYLEDKKNSPESGWDLGTDFLSYTTILGNEIENDLPEYNITIGPLDDEEIELYMPGGKMHAYVQLINSYFLPMGYEKNIIINANNENKFVDLADEYLLLGINTTLN